MDIYAFFYAVATIVCVVGIALQIKNNINRFLTKRQNILLAVLVGVFQVGVFFICWVTLAQIAVEVSVLGDNLFYRDEERLLMWEYVGYGVLALLSVLVQIPYLKLVSYSVEPVDQRDTLITTEDAIDA